MDEIFLTTIETQPTNRYYLYPEFKYKRDGKLEIIGDAEYKYPSSGRIWLKSIDKYKKELDEYKGMLIKVNRKSIEENRGYTEKSYTEKNKKNSLLCKYYIDYEKNRKYITLLKDEEILEVVDFDKTFEEVLSKEEYRKINLKNKLLNKKIILKIKKDNNLDEYYGPFETEKENTLSEVYKITAIKSNKVFKYKSDKIKDYIFEVNVNPSKNKKNQVIKHFIEKFIIEEEETDFIEEEINFITDDLLKKNIQNILDISKINDENLTLITKDMEIYKEFFTLIENNNNIKEEVNKIIKTLESDDDKIQNIKNTTGIGVLKAVIKKINDLSGLNYDINTIKNFNLNNYNIKKIIEQIKNNDKNMVKLEENIFKDMDIQERDLNRINKILIEDNNLEEIEELKKKIINIYINSEDFNLENKMVKELLENSKVYKEGINKKTEELHDLEKKNTDLKKKNTDLKKKNTDLEKKNTDLEKKNTDLENHMKNYDNNLEEKLFKWIIEEKDNSIISKLLLQSERYEEKDNYIKNKNMNISNKYSISKINEADKIIDRVLNKFISAGRDIGKNDVINYLILLSSNIITVFAGEPGTGKTSTCSILSKALGLYDERYADICVAKGWNSNRDLIGYYNPLTHCIEKTQPKFTRCLETLNEESKLVDNEEVDALYLTLLDEANLSPIEYYWSDFIGKSDNYIDDDQIISIGDENYNISKKIRFLATINYDHTTETLSPRFLDRAWVVKLEDVNISDLINKKNKKEKIKNEEEIISYKTLTSLFSIHGKNSYELSKHDSKVLEEFISGMEKKSDDNDNSKGFKDLKNIISPRSMESIRNYCSVASNYMDDPEKNCLDYAISQKLLPKIDGNGGGYLEALNNLKAFCAGHKFNRSIKIIDSIIEKGNEYEEFNYFNV